MPGFDLTGRAEAYASSNTLGGTDALLQSQPGPVADRRPAGRARAVAALRQQPGPGADGRCRPLCRAGYANNWIGTINYEHRWRFDPLTEFRYGVMLMRRVYDGSVENTLGFVIGLRQRI